jgi:hypothetical protein
LSVLAAALERMVQVRETLDAESVYGFANTTSVRRNGINRIEMTMTSGECPTRTKAVGDHVDGFPFHPMMVAME